MENAEHVKLLLSAEVWKLAEAERKKAERSAFVVAARSGGRVNEATFWITFEQEHPIAEFVPKVIEQLRDISKLL